MDRLRIFRIITFETRFLRADVIDVLKIMMGYEYADPCWLVQACKQSLRGMEQAGWWNYLTRGRWGEFEASASLLGSVDGHPWQPFIITIRIYTLQIFALSKTANMANTTSKIFQILKMSAGKKFSHYFVVFEYSVWIQTTNRLHQRYLQSLFSRFLFEWAQSYGQCRLPYLRNLTMFFRVPFLSLY